MEIEKLIKAIRCCGSTPKLDRCKNECAFYCGGDMNKCIQKMTKAVANALETVTAERDAAIEDIPKCCFNCAKNKTCELDTVYDDSECEYFKWQGR